MTKSIFERMLNSEMTEHLEYERNTLNGNKDGNYRNGTSQETIKSNLGEISKKLKLD